MTQRDATPKDPKRWERRLAFMAGWLIGLIILHFVGVQPMQLF
jgi:hypothetical protein